MEKRGRGRPKGSTRMTERNTMIVQMFQEGKTQGEIGATFGLTRARVQQVLKRAGLDRWDGGQTARLEAGHNARIQRIDELYIQKWGHTRAQHRFLFSIAPGTSATSPVGAYKRQRANAFRQGHAHTHVVWKWDLSLADWWKCWLDSGKWAQRGRGRGHYCLVRKDATKPFQADNIQVVAFEKAIAIGRGQV